MRQVLISNLARVINPTGHYDAGQAWNNFAEYQGGLRNLYRYVPLSWKVYLGNFPDRPER